MTNCIHCGSKLTKKKKAKLKIVFLNDDDLEFIRESNHIEGEYSFGAFHNACESFRWAFGNKSRKINKNYILAVHQILMKNLNSRIAGKFRKCDVMVGGRKCLDPKEIKKALGYILKIEPLNGEGIKEWHIEFEKIHPFEDGNGRTGRIIMNIQRLKIGLPILIIHEGKEQQEYYKWFKEGKK